MPRRRLEDLLSRAEQFMIRHRVEFENAKAYALLAVICLIAACLGYVAGRIDGRDEHRAEIERLQAAHAALLLERGQRIDELTEQIDRLTERTTEAAATAAEAARAASSAVEAATPDQEASKP